MANARTEAVAELVRRLGHDFRNTRLLDRALTHASVGEGVAPQTSRAPRDNERLEFLGDRVLGLLVAERLHEDFPEADEGQLSSRLHALVDKHACGRVGARLGVGEAVRLSPGETKSGGRRKEGVIADAVEAILAAVYLDGGIDAARRVFDKAWAEELARPPERTLTNPKSALQEWAQAQGRRQQAGHLRPAIIGGEQRCGRPQRAGQHRAIGQEGFGIFGRPGGAQTGGQPGFGIARAWRLAHQPDHAHPNHPT
jgi:ribonuclease-3